MHYLTWDVMACPRARIYDLNILTERSDRAKVVVHHLNTNRESCILEDRDIL